jgi:hypothetical protein
MLERLSEPGGLELELCAGTDGVGRIPGGGVTAKGGGIDEAALEDAVRSVDEEAPPTPGSIEPGLELPMLDAAAAGAALSGMGLDIFTSYRPVPRGEAPLLSLISLR